MPLRDHFHPPLSEHRPWDGLHSFWNTAMAEHLNQLLPANYFASPERHAGAGVEIDVATFETDRNEEEDAGLRDGGGAAVATQLYAPPAAALKVATAFADDIEVKVFRELGGNKLVAAIELVSPGNKDREDKEMAFANKCASYLHNGVAVVVIDVVTDRRANLHDRIMTTVTVDPVPELGEGVLYAVAYRPIRRKGKERIEAWPVPLAVGDPLPTLPLWLNAVTAVPLDLEGTYLTMLQRARLPQTA
jgi:hypothetical protein